MARNVSFVDPHCGPVLASAGRSIAFERTGLSLAEELTIIGMLVSEDIGDQRDYAAFARTNGDDMFDPLTMLMWRNERRKEGSAEEVSAGACRHLPSRTAPNRGFVHKPESWNGGNRWPFADGQPVADVDGLPLKPGRIT